MRVFLVLLLLHAAQCAAAVSASGRHWRLSIDSLACEAADSLAVGTRIRYLGPKGPVEAPLARLVDEKGKPYPPKSLVWKGGNKALAPWLASGGLANVQAEDVGEIQLKFDTRGASGVLRLEFGDIGAFALTRKGACLKLEELRPPRAPRRARAEGSGLVVHRARYPCGPPVRNIEAGYPPYPPKQLLVFGRGYLPNARQVELPMGTAPAQSYAFAGPDDMITVEQAARRALPADFPQYAGAKHFAFNWGLQRSQTGNEIYSVGVYELRPCPGG